MISMVSYALTYVWWVILIVVCLTFNGSVGTEATLPEATVINVAETLGASYQAACVVLGLIVLSPALFYSWQHWMIEVLRLPFAVASMAALGILLRELPVEIQLNSEVVAIAFLSAILASVFFQGVRGKAETVSIARATSAHGVANAVIILIAIVASNASLQSVASIAHAIIIWALAYPLAWRSVAVGRISPLTRATEAIVFSSFLLFLAAYIVAKRLKRLL